MYSSFSRLFLMLFSKNISGIYLSQCLQFFSYGLFVPASAYFINSVLPIQDKTKGQAALGIFTFGLSGLVSSVLSGVLLDHFTVRTMLALESGLAFIGMFGVIVACHLLASGKDI
ncbi:MFS transporter [[Clostridium] scindens]|uniref:MFS transporter n=1 Tax=Clostridium scindens (strain JCM 10418 / VPI 12708) TaxID=29347 RepID=UPI002168000E|nr:MFS transporter [[Clostridium] scindens]